MDLNLSLPLNTLSFGFCSYNILLELYKRNIPVNLFATNNSLDLAAYTKADEDFKFYLNTCMTKARKDFSRDSKGFRLWHIDGSETNVSKNNTLFTFYELDNPTDTEINILNNQSKIIVSSRETKAVFENFGVQAPITYCPLAYDANNFYRTNKKYYDPDVIVFGIFGKFEKRKHHEKAVKAWLKKFGNSKKYVLHTHLYNPHFKPEDNNQFLAKIFDGKPKPFNVNCLPYMKTLTEFNDCLNVVNIVMDVSGGEGFSLPSFHCIGMGKHGIIHNCSAMKDWATSENAVLIEPSGKEEVYDGVFFHKGQEFNQGNIYTWDEDAFIHACEEAIVRHEANPVNVAGLEIQKDFTWEKTVDTILETINKE